MNGDVHKLSCPNCGEFDVRARVRVEGSGLIPVNVDKPKQPHMIDWQTTGKIQFYECRDCGHRW